MKTASFSLKPFATTLFFTTIAEMLKLKFKTVQDGLVEVKLKGGRSRAYPTTIHECSCDAWKNMAHFPCRHMMALLDSLNMSVFCRDAIPSKFFRPEKKEDFIPVGVDPSEVEKEWAWEDAWDELVTSPRTYAIEKALSPRVKYKQAFVISQAISSTIADFGTSKFQKYLK